MSKADIKGSNLVKSYRLAGTQAETRVIDSNSSIEEKLARIRSILPAEVFDIPETDNSEHEFVDGLDALMLDNYDSEIDTAFDEEGNPVSNVIKAGMSDNEAPVYSGPDPSELIAEAEAQIEEMRLAAEADIEAARTEAYNEGMQSGYNEGLARA